MCNSRRNSRSNSIDFEFIVCWEDKSPRDGMKSRTISSESNGTIENDEHDEHDESDENNTKNNHTFSKYNDYTSHKRNVIHMRNGHKIRRRDVNMEVLCYDPSPTPSLFLEKIKGHDEWCHIKHHK